MNTEALFALTPETAHIDRWLFEGKWIERWNGAGFHTPAHVGVVVNVSMLLARWCRNHPQYRAFGYGCPYLLSSDPDTLVTFDGSLADRTICDVVSVDATHIVGSPRLAIEVIELDEDPDLVEASLRHGVGTMWVIDPYELIVVIHRNGASPQYANGQMSLTAGDAVPGFTCSGAEIFE